jgi:hypothetical protein
VYICFATRTKSTARACPAGVNKVGQIRRRKLSVSSSKLAKMKARVQDWDRRGRRGGGEGRVGRLLWPKFARLFVARERSTRRLSESSRKRNKGRSDVKKGKVRRRFATAWVLLAKRGEVRSQQRHSCFSLSTETLPLSFELRLLPSSSRAATTHHSLTLSHSLSLYVPDMPLCFHASPTSPSSYTYPSALFVARLSTMLQDLPFLPTII